jgi:glycosyltransferase involved in cell wall biosynthesis
MTDVLRIAIVHYHLRPGGVTTVIKQAVASLKKKDCRVVILAGSEATQEMPEGTVCAAVEGLNYAVPSEPPCSPEVLLGRMDEAARRSLGSPPDLWHIHNHSLGKNCVFTQAVFLMAARGNRLLLQIHDFPEDGRPANYRELLRHVGDDNSTLLGTRLYPQAPHVHYATLNGRDCDFLCRAGADAIRVHLLPNAVSMPPDAKSAGSTRGRLFLYPTRAIRRKNLGEFLLWSTLAEKGDRFATTLAPTSAIDRAPYEQWVKVAGSLRLPVEFAVGLRTAVPFETLLNSAHAVVTTSVAEGFGLAFLEPWVAGRPLVGRDLPELTNVLKKQGLDLRSLYTRLLVPLVWVGAEVVRDKIAAGMNSMFADYGRVASEGVVTRAFESAVDADRVDFGRLDENMQETILRRVARDPTCRRELDRPPILAQVPDAALIEGNRSVVEREYNGEQYGRRLTRIYGEIMGSDTATVGAFRAESLLDSFLEPERFFLLRS